MVANPGAESPLPAPRGDAGSPGAAVESDALLARRVQMLATEHWGLLAARSTAQSEVLTRITIFLTLVSAGLVTIGLLGQVSGFAGWFPPGMIAILAFLCVIGIMTQTRVMNVGDEDMMYVVAMNRLRGGYVDLDPQLAQYFLAAVADDEAGMERSYSFILRRSTFRHMFGSSAVLIVVVNACVDGLLAGAIVMGLTEEVGWAVTAGVCGGLLWALASTRLGFLHYREAWRSYRPRRMTQA